MEENEQLRNTSIPNLDFVIEHFFQCPYCWEEISMLLDSSVRHQSYVEDCEVCCRPIEINVSFEEANLIEFQSEKLED